MATLPEFSLKDLLGTECKFPSERHALLCFVKEDCPTCQLTMPLIEAAHTAFASPRTLQLWQARRPRTSS